MFSSIVLILRRNLKLPLVNNNYCFCNANKFDISSTIAKSSKLKSSTLKEKLLNSLNFKSNEDSTPFSKLPNKTLIYINRVTKHDNAKGYCSNRLYYLASKLQCPPAELSKHLANRTFVYELSFDWLENSLNTLLEMGISTDRILRDMWVLKYHHITIKQRLQSIKERGIDKLYPWMVRCTPEILNRYITIAHETKNILGDYESTQIYLANRLNTSLESVEEMCQKLPALRTIRVTKVKNFIDFLIEEGFDSNEIVDKPRVLASSQKTIQKRIKLLKQLGFEHINLNILCRSRKDFQKYIHTIESVLETKKQ